MVGTVPTIIRMITLDPCDVGYLAIDDGNVEVSPHKNPGLPSDLIEDMLDTSFVKHLNNVLRDMRYDILLK